MRKPAQPLETEAARLSSELQARYPASFAGLIDGRVLQVLVAEGAPGEDIQRFLAGALHRAITVRSVRWSLGDLQGAIEDASTALPRQAIAVTRLGVNLADNVVDVVVDIGDRIRAEAVIGQDARLRLLSGSGWTPAS